MTTFITMIENIEHKFATVNGIKLHYVTAGKGPLLILLHGFPEFWYGWRNQIPELSKHFKVVAPDLPGYNESDKPRAIKRYSSKIVANDIQELIFALNEKKAHIIGHDWGGAIAWTLAQYFPDCIDKLIVLNCPLPPTLAEHFFKSFNQLKRSWYMFFFQLPYFPERYMNRDLRTFFYRGLRGWSHNKKAFSDNDIEMYVKAFEKPGSLTGAINYYRAAFRNSAKSESRKILPIKPDTLVIWGEDDKALGKELTYNMEKHFQNHFELKYISNCSHWVQHEYPDVVNKYILNFLKPV